MYNTYFITPLVPTTVSSHPLFPLLLITPFVPTAVSSHPLFPLVPLLPHLQSTPKADYGGRLPRVLLPVHVQLPGLLLYLRPFLLQRPKGRPQFLLQPPALDGRACQVTPQNLLRLPLILKRNTWACG